MTIKGLVQLSNTFAGEKADPQIQVFTNLSRPADLISLEYCKENNVIYLKYETKDQS